MVPHGLAPAQHPGARGGAAPVFTLRRHPGAWILAGRVLDVWRGDRRRVLVQVPRSVRQHLLDERPAEDRSNEAPEPSLETCMQMSLFGGAFLRLAIEGTPVAVDDSRFGTGTKSPSAAEAEGFNVYTLRWWSCQLRREPIIEDLRPKFIEVAMSVPESAAIVTLAGLEVVVRGVRVVVPINFDEGTLRRVLRVVEVG